MERKTWKLRNNDLGDYLTRATMYFCVYACMYDLTPAHDDIKGVCVIKGQGREGLRYKNTIKKQGKMSL